MEVEQKRKKDEVVALVVGNILRISLDLIYSHRS